MLAHYLLITLHVPPFGCNKVATKSGLSCFGYSKHAKWGAKLFANPTKQPTISCSFPINADLKKRLETLAFSSRISQREHLQRALRNYLNESEQQTDKQA